MITRSAFLFALGVMQAGSSFALKFSVEGRTAIREGLSRRAQVGGSSNSSTSNGTGISVGNYQNTVYFSDITVGGTTVSVLLDTGSSDLWVAKDIQNTKDLGVQSSVSYAIGNAAGNINSATVQFDDYTVDDQVYLLVKDASSFGDIHSSGYDGLIGLGPSSGSNVRKQLAKTNKTIQADTILDRIFQQNKTTQNFISFALDRQNDTSDLVSGQFTISEVISGLENITSMPKLNVEFIQSLATGNQHWQILTDKDVGIIGPDGNPILQNSIVPKAPKGQLVAVFDSGFTLPQVPRKVADAIYGRVQGAQYDTDDEIWLVPCDQLLNLAFTFGGKQYPIHPLDTVSDIFTKNDNGTICAGVFQPITSAFDIFGDFDLILGMGFLRNTYTLLDFGNFISTSSNDRGNPYVQLLSLTDPKAAHDDFVKVRMNGTDRTSDAKYQLLPVSQMQHSPISDAEKRRNLQEKILSRWPFILMACFVLVLLSVGCCVWRCCCRRGARANNRSRGFKPREMFSRPRKEYKPLGGNDFDIHRHEHVPLA